MLQYSKFTLLDECFDVDDDCQNWGTSNNCEEYPKKALNCQKSCGKCNCEDKVSYCKYYTYRCNGSKWAKEWAKKNCAKTCNLCTSAELPIPQTTLPAEPSGCADWDEDYCKTVSSFINDKTCKNNEYYIKYCKKTCGKCNDTTSTTTTTTTTTEKTTTEG